MGTRNEVLHYGFPHEKVQMATVPGGVSLQP